MMKQRIIFLPVLLTVAFLFISPAQAGDTGKLYVVGMGPAGPELTAPRVLEIIQKADVLLCSPGIPKKFKMFDTYIDPGKIAFNPWEGILGQGKQDPQKAEQQKRKVQAYVLDQIKQGKTVVMMDGGDPCVYGPSLHYLLDGFDDAMFEVIPGMGAFNAAGAALKRPFTTDGTRLVLLTSPQSMFGENWDKDDTLLKDLSKYDTTMVWYMSLRSLDKVVERMVKYYPPELPIAVVYYAGYPDKEKVLKSCLGTILEDIKKMDEKWLGLFITGKCAE